MLCLRSVTGAITIAILAACSSSDPSNEGPSSPTSEAGTLPTDGDAGNDASSASGEAGADAGIDAATLAPVETRTIETLSTTCVDAPAEFGAYGDVTQYRRYEVKNPAWKGEGELPVVVFEPINAAATHPVVFFSHPYGGTDWHRMAGLLEFLVSHDHVVVFTPYATKGASVCERYDALWGGFTAAVDVAGAITHMDTTRVGFVGHSFGGGATPWIAHEAIKQRGWGASGVFLFSSAPWYGYRMTANDWADFPPKARLTTMVYADDPVNDHRVAISDVWQPFPRSKSYVRLVSAEHAGNCDLVADHGTPQAAKAFGTFSALDSWGVWRQIQAIAACTLRDSNVACALSEGTAPSATAMGTWTSDGTAVPAAERPDPPLPAKPEGDYVFPAENRDDYPCTGAGAGP